MSVYSVNVYPSSTTIKTGNWYYGAYATVNANSDCETDVEWYSNNASVATVNPTLGYIYGISPGTARIYAQSKVDNSKKDYITVTVTSGTICVESVSLNRSSISLEKGDCFSLTATVCPTNATNKAICWRSTNTGVATVSDGIVVAKASGSAYIYAEATDGSGEYDVCYVNVTEDVLVSSIMLNHSTYTLNANGSVLLRETVCPANATNKCVEWYSDNPQVAFVNPNSGFVMALGTGTATIRATAQDGSDKYAECTVTVNPPIAVTDIQVCPTSLTMRVGDTARLCAVICPENATNKQVTWHSSDENVACVNYYTGEIIAKTKGTTTITAKTVSENKTGTCTITVDSWEKVIVEKGENSNYSRIVFKNGKVWNCINKDIINGYNLDRNDPLTHLFYENVYETKVYDEGTGFTHYYEPLKEYTEEEKKLIYTIDPLGFAGYVDKYAEKEFRSADNTEDMLKNLLEYKDSIFYLLFKRHPSYYRRDLCGSWQETTDKSNLHKVLSESEFLFGYHIVYDIYTFNHFISVVLDIVSIVTQCPALKMLKLIPAISTVAKYYSLGRSVAKSALDGDFCEFVTAVAGGLIDEDKLDNDFITPQGYKTENYMPGWAVELLSFSSDLSALADTLNSGPHFYKEIFEMCANDIKYDIVIRTTDNKLVSLSDINNAI